ncbi:hypothetical protein AB0C59_10845 [Streptomyces sp. NPDC048664]|uniref:hypothetical protein n=1 Tax=Streptomyces sp. NPDC048664 TaxID=3154505 RepID=UPI00343498A9
MAGLAPVFVEFLGRSDGVCRAMTAVRRESRRTAEDTEGLPATLTIAFLRSNLAHAELAAPHDISVSTCWRYIEQGIAELAARAIRLTDVVRLARKAGNVTTWVSAGATV